MPSVPGIGSGSHQSVDWSILQALCCVQVQLQLAGLFKLWLRMQISASMLSSLHNCA